MRAAGVKLTIASNNMPGRVAPFAKRVGLEYQAFCCKPSPFGLRRARRAMAYPAARWRWWVTRSLRTRWGANLYGIPVLLVQPMRQDTKATIRLKRALEKPVLARYYKKGGRVHGKEEDRKPPDA